MTLQEWAQMKAREQQIQQQREMMVRAMEERARMAMQAPQMAPPQFPARP